jgi:alkylation response protein AidB-like acyl-CoA dehydrogenase
MDVRLSTEQRDLRDSVAQVVDRLRPQAVMDLGDAARAAKLDATIGEVGWRELRSAGEDGAPWAGAVEAAIVAEQLGRGVADASYIGPALAADLRRLAGLDAAEVTETVAFTTDLDHAAWSTDSATLTEPVLAVDAAGAQRALVFVQGDGHNYSVASVAVAGETVGIDLTRRNVLIPAGTPLTVLSEPLSREAYTRWRAFGLALTCADLVGVMQGAITLANDYAKVRAQYGAAIGSFQALQHMLAEAFTLYEGSRSTALHAAWAVDAEDAEHALKAGALAKAYCARSAQTIVETCIQVHGGIGNTWECLAHVFLRRSLVDTDLFGGIGASLATVLAAYDLKIGA